MGGAFTEGKSDTGAAELAQEKAEREEKSRKLMLKRLQMLKRRGGDTGGGDGVTPTAQDQQDLLGG